MRNWSGHVEFGAASIASPTSVAELQALVAGSARIRALGTAHSFNAIADTSGTQVVLALLPQQVEIDPERRVAWLPAGMRYGTAARIVDEAGWAFHNMASLGHISLAGTIATGTHGSGDRNPTLSAAVWGLEFVSAPGDLVEVTADSDPDLLAASVVSLGCLGVVTRVALRLEPTYDVQQFAYDGVPLAVVEENFDQVFSSAYSVSLFTAWGPSRTGQVWQKHRTAGLTAMPPDEWMGGRLATGKRHPLPDHDPVHCTEQQGVSGPWHERLPHFRLDFTPSSGDELQTEYLVPRERVVEAMLAVDSLADAINPLLQVSEVRTMCADDLWLSGAYGRDTVGIHFTWRKVPEVGDVLPELDSLLGPLGGRPHWGKLFDARTPVAHRYPRFAEFAELVQEVDNTGKFQNEMTAHVLSGL
jgi:xylitol oxidase